MTSLSGIANTVAALLPVPVADACCAGTTTAPDANSGGSFCPLPDCACAFCLSAEVVEFVPVSTAVTSDLVLHPSPYQLRLADIATTIDYPPELL